MLIVVPIAVGWLAVATLCAALCRAAARGDDVTLLEPQLENRPALEQLAISESSSEPTVRDTRRASEEREPAVLLGHA